MSIEWKMIPRLCVITAGNISYFGRYKRAGKTRETRRIRDARGAVDKSVHEDEKCH